MNCNLSCLKCDLSWFKCSLGGCSQSSHRFVHVIWLSIVVWVFSIVAVADCSFARAGFVNTDYSDLAETGLFSYNLASDEHLCVSFSTTVNHSAAVKTARAFGVICCLLTSFIMLQALSLRLFLQHQRAFVWKTTCIQSMLAPLAQALTFTAFGDDNCTGSNVKCVPGAAGVIAIFNIFFLIALAVLCWFAIPSEQPLFEIKRLEIPTTSPEQKPTTVEDMESEHHSVDDVEAQSDHGSVYKNEDVDNDAAVEELDQVVKAAAADSKFSIRSVRPISPDSEKRRHTFSPRHSPVRKLEKGEGSPAASQLAEV